MELLIQFITNSALISLIVGFCVGVYSRYTIPKIFSWIISLYLVFCIGFKGGLCLGVTSNCTAALTSLALVGIIIGLIQPFIYYVMLHFVAHLDRQTQVVVAAQYGSISIVTFVTALSFLHRIAVPYDTFMTAIAGMMEIPALFSGMLLLQGDQKQAASMLKSFLQIVYNILTTEKITTIFVGFFVGYLLRGYQQHDAVQFFLWPFGMALVFFMIDIGIKIAQQRHYIHQFTWGLIAFGVYVPVISGLMSIGVSVLLGLQVGTAVLFAVLIGSASYIAVPAVMGTQAPEAKEVIYLPLSLCITLPFNLVIGIPLFYYCALWAL